jgi:hypothetical protein
MPDNFTHQVESAATQWVNQRTHLNMGGIRGEGVKPLPESALAFEVSFVNMC